MGTCLTKRGRILIVVLARNSHEKAQKSPGRQVQKYLLEASNRFPRERKFDCVLAIQVIEHVYQPLTFVKQLINHTQPGGHIIIATPDIGGVLRKTMGRHWPSFKVPEHVRLLRFSHFKPADGKSWIE